jgi:hypothetical protein
MNGEPMSVDGSAISGRDSSFDWAREWFGIVVGYALNLPDGSVYEENIITGISRRTRQHRATNLSEIVKTLGHNSSESLVSDYVIYYEPFVISNAEAFFLE